MSRPHLPKSEAITPAPYAAQFLRDVAMFFRICFQFWRGFHFLRRTRRAVTIFGSARIKTDHPMYALARETAGLMARQGFEVITGGGPAIMQAANQGAYEAGGKSTGINIHIPREQHLNPFVHKCYTARYFFVRKVLLCRYSEAFIIFPGGMGTLDETFEILTLIQTGKMIDRPVVLVGREFWHGLLHWMEHTLVPYGTVNLAEVKRFKVVDTAAEVMATIAPIV